MSEPLRQPPCNYEAERAMLGTILMNNRAFEKVSEILYPHHFADPLNAFIYDTIGRMIEQGHQATIITIRAHVENSDLLRAAGGMKYVVSLAAGVVTFVNAREYGLILRDLFLKRELIAISHDTMNAAFDPAPEETANDLIESAEAQLFALTAGTFEGGFDSVYGAARAAVEKAEAAYKRNGALVGLDTGLRDINRRLGGLHPADLLILAGRPSMGKTALALAIAYNAAAALLAAGTIKAVDGGVVGFFSLEMAKDQLIMRLMAHLAGLKLHEIRNGQISGADIATLQRVSETLERLPLHIDDTAGLSIQAIRTRCRRLSRKHAKQGGLKAIFIDYLQLIGRTGGEQSENRVQEISAITRGLKGLAKEFKVPVVALSQLSRAVEQRENKRPLLSDLRESGTIEQDADIVMFVYRDEYYLEREGEPEDSNAKAKWCERLDRARNVAEVITAKQRQGPVGTDTLHFAADTTWFTDLAKPRSGEDD